MYKMTKPSLNKKLIVYSLATIIYFFIGFIGAQQQAKEPSGYVASYTFLFNLFFGGFLILVLFIVGLILLFDKDARWYAPAFLLSLLLIPIGFAGSLKTLSVLGKVRYEIEDRMIPIGSDMPKGLIILFKKQTSNEQIEQFRLDVLGKPHPEGRGSYLADGLCLYGSSPKVQDYDAVEVRFCANATEEQQAQLKSNVLASPLVYKVIEDVKPNETKKLSEGEGTSNNSMDVRAKQRLFITVSFNPLLV